MKINLFLLLYRFQTVGVSKFLSLDGKYWFSAKRFWRAGTLNKYLPVSSESLFGLDWRAVRVPKSNRCFKEHIPEKQDFLQMTGDALIVFTKRRTGDMKGAKD